MPWRISYDENGKFIDLDFDGEITDGDVRDSNAAVHAMVADKNVWSVLTDFSAATRLAIPSIDIFRQATELSSAFREAVVCPKRSALRPSLDFYETVCINRGKTVRLFEQRPDALRWLIP